MTNTETQIDFEGNEIGYPNLLNLELKDFLGAVDVPESLKNRIGKMEDGEFQPDEVISGLSKINILVGANNSGKSYIMREILKSDLQLQYFSPHLFSKFNEILTEFQERFSLFIERQFPPRKAFSSDDFYISSQQKIILTKQSLLERLQPLPSGKTGASLIAELKERYAAIGQSPETTQVMLGGGAIHFTRDKDFRKEFLGLFEELFSRLESLLNGRVCFNFNETKGVHRIFIIEHRNLLRSEREAMMTGKAEGGKTFLDNGFQYHIWKNYFQDLTGTPRLSRNSSGSFGTLEKLSSNKAEAYSDNLEVLNGYNVFDDIAEFFNSGDGRRRLEEYEKFLSEQFFDGQEVYLTPSRDNQIQEFVLKIGDEPELMIQNLGTGLQMMILFTLPLFQYEEGIFFIEEPELFMHPGMQRHLLSIFATHARTKNFVFFMTTHSNHIIDASLNASIAEISTFTVRKFKAEKADGEPETKFSVTKLTHDGRDALSVLGVLNSSVYLANCTIWVEGISDKRYITAFLDAFVQYLRTNRDKTDLPEDIQAEVQKFQKCLSYREGTHYAFVFSGGNNIVHWNFDEDADSWQEHIEHPVVRDICGRALVIVDRDTQKKDGKPKAEKRKEYLKGLLGDRFVELEVNEIENLLPLDALEAAIREYKGCKTFSMPTGTDKESLKKQLLQGKTKIGTFIDEKLLLKTSAEKHSFAAESGTIKNKQKFCNNVIETRKVSWENMPKPAQELVHKVFEFILQQNNP